MSCVKSQHGFFRPLSLGDELNFRLTYDGPLKSQSQSDSRRTEKHAIRCALSKQLYQLMQFKSDILEREWENMPSAEFRALVHRRGNLSFLALVRERLNLVCDLDILFLRRENPGSLICEGGDIDNRIKVLFDALRIPQDDNEVRGLPPDNHFIICLTENDSLITGFRVTTDRLLEPPEIEEHQNCVRLIINVEIKATKLTEENLAYFSHF